MIVGVGSDESHASGAAPFEITPITPDVHETAPGQAVTTTWNVTNMDTGYASDSYFTHLGQIFLGLPPLNHSVNFSAELVPGWTNVVSVGVPPCRTPVFDPLDDLDGSDDDDYYDNGTFRNGQNVTGALKHPEVTGPDGIFYCPTSAGTLGALLEPYQRVNLTLTSTPDDSQLFEQTYVDLAWDQDTQNAHNYTDPNGQVHENEIKPWQRHQFAVHDVDLPVFLTVATDQAVYTSDPSPVTGTVSATFLDASPVVGKDVNLMEFAAVGTSRGERLTLDASGSAAFSIQGDILGLGADLGLPTYMLTHKQPGEHTVRAEVIGAAPQNPEATSETTYTVS